MAQTHPAKPASLCGGGDGFSPAWPGDGGGGSHARTHIQSWRLLPRTHVAAVVAHPRLLDSRGDVPAQLGDGGGGSPALLVNNDGGGMSGGMSSHNMVANEEEDNFSK